MTKRLPQWEIRLAQAIVEARGGVFAWGTRDCATWAFDVRLALTGHDGWPYRGKYKTLRGAMGVIRRNGGSMEGLGRSLLGDPLPAVLLAQRGDIVLGGEDPALGVCIGSEAAFLLQAGLTYRPLKSCQLAWRV